MLVTLDPTATAGHLTAGTLDCPHPDCDGTLGPWGHARPRILRLGAGRHETHRPRRARCRRCQRTQVLIGARSYPRRPDPVEAVGAALMASVNGLGHRRVAEQVGLPATTVRGWLRRARANSETVRANATIAVHALDPMADALGPTGTVLGDMIEAVGRAVAAHVRRLGPSFPPWQLALAITRGAILAPRPARIIDYLSG